MAVLVLVAGPAAWGGDRPGGAAAASAPSIRPLTCPPEALPTSSADRAAAVAATRLQVGAGYRVLVATLARPGAKARTPASRLFVSCAADRAERTWLVQVRSTGRQPAVDVDVYLASTPTGWWSARSGGTGG